MSTEKDQLNVLLQQAQDNFMPPVSIQIDITQMQNILQGMCQQMMRMQTEIDGLKSQLNLKANQNDFIGYATQINNKIDNVLENNNENINQINSNMESLKNALIAGLEKCQSDALNVARDLVAEVKPVSAQTETRKSPSQSPRIPIPSEPQVIYMQTPIPTSDLEELTKQLQLLSERVIQIENDREIPSNDLKEKMSELSKKSREISQNNSVDQTPTIQTPISDKRTPGSPDLETSNRLYDINDAIRTINERLNQLENEDAERTIKVPTDSQFVPDEVYQELREHSEQIKKLTDELTIAKTTHVAPPPSQIELPPDNREAISQLNDRLYEIESNFANFSNATNDLSKQINDQKTQLSEYEKLLEKYKNEANSSNEANMESIKELINAEIKRNAKEEDENNNDIFGENNGIDDDDEQADESDNSMDTPRHNRLSTPNDNLREIQKPAPTINTDELLESFLDATRAEVDKARKAILDELSGNLRNTTTQLSGNISKVQATFDIDLKKVNSQLTEQFNQIQSDIKNQNFDNQNAIKDLHVSDANILEKIRLIEQRLESVLKIANAPPPKMEALIDKKGKLDLAPLLQQIQSQAAQLDDIKNRTICLEAKEHVSPASFNSLLDLVSAHDGQLSQLEVKSAETINQLNTVKTIVDSLNSKVNSPEAEIEAREMKEKAQSLDEETKRLCDAMVKFNKDLISMRVAINTLRSHSEETSGSVEDIIKMCEKAREDAASTEKRLKKVVSFVQGETQEMSNQIKDIAASVERNADRIEEIANRMSSSVKTPLSGLYDEEEEEEEDKNSSHKNKRPKSKKSKENSLSSSPSKSEVKYESVMTSPHLILPPLEERKDSQEELIIPKISPHNSQKHEQQPIVPVVKKNLDAEQVSRSVTTKAPLPRLAKVPGQQIRSQSELTKNDLRKYDDLFSRIDQLEQKFNTIKSAVDVLNKTTKNLQDNKAEKDALQALFDQFRLAMGELNNRIGSLRKNIIQKADIAELVQVRTDILREIKIQGETAAGTEPVRCLLCGNPRHNIAGAFDQQMTINTNASNINVNPMQITKAGLNSLSVSSRVSGADGSVCYVYGNNGQMYLGRSQDGKPVVLKNLLNDPGNEGNGEPIQGTVPLPGAQ